jgi:hypothetical protein
LSRASQDGKLMAQQQVLEHEVLARAQPGQGGHEHEPQQVKHAHSIAYFHSAEVLIPIWLSSYGSQR